MRVASSLKNLLATKPTTTVAFSAALALATGLAALAAVQPAAHAAIATCSGFNPLFDGFISDPNPQTGIEGVSGNIRVEDATLCTNNSGAYNTTSSWVMIESPSAGGLAQVGVWRYPGWTGSGPQYFYEFGATDFGSPVGWHSGVPTGSTHRFWVQWIDNGCPAGLLGCFSFNIDTTRIAVSNFNPYAAWGSPNNRATVWNMQFAGEVHDNSTDIMGSNAGGVATVWSSLQAQDAVTDGYRGFTCNLTAVVNSDRFGLNSASNHACGSWSTYTKA
jgi:hypothetical protein